MTEKENSADLLAEEVTNLFCALREKRRKTERTWQLCVNFLKGNQYCDVNDSGEIYEEEKKYFWQNRRTFNHIAAIVDMRCSKLSRIRPALTVRAASDDESDRRSAEIASAVLASAGDECDIDGVINDATVWSETCGTAFYKIVWDSDAGATVAFSADGAVKQGNVRVFAVSPFEIYPYSLREEKLQNQPGIIHARAIPVEDIYAAYGVRLFGRTQEETELMQDNGKKQPKVGAEGQSAATRYEILIERYERQSPTRPDGRYTVVAGGKLLYDGDLPYVNAEDNRRGYPFVRQTSNPVAGSFFGSSMVERLIPVQRAYNAVKNRKHEFLNRISMGTVAVEDGSLDVDELAEDGLMPGKVIVYRQGGKPPEMLTMGSVPDEFDVEEERLLEEFEKVSGTSELSQKHGGLTGVTSATGLQLLIEQDDARLNCAYQQVRRALKEIGKQILRLYRQFATDLRLLKFAGENNGLGLFYFKGSDISSDDVVLEADSDSNLTPAQRRTVLYEIIDRGLFSGEDGKISNGVKSKLLQILGYDGFSAGRDMKALHTARAGEENLAMRTEECEVKQYDDHAAHIDEHVAFMLTEKLPPETERRICAHVREHKNKLKEVQNG